MFKKIDHIHNKRSQVTYELRIIKKKTVMSVVAVRDIKTTYEISRNSWQGDPCVPRQFMWDGLNCSNTDTSTPRITYL